MDGLTQRMSLVDKAALDGMDAKAKSVLKRMDDVVTRKASKESGKSIP